MTHLKRDAGEPSPNWSPDGTRIAIALEGAELGVDVMNADGSDRHEVAAKGLQPAFTPDGDELVYSCDCGKGVLLMRDDGSDAPGEPLSMNPVDDVDPEVSPDGQTVTFVRRKREHELQALYAVNIDGSDERRLTPYGLEVAIKHDWAPDGRQIVLTAYADYPDHKSPNVATMRPDGSHLRMLTHYTGGKQGAFAGSYSPDGRWIVFRVENLKRERFRLYKMRPDGTQRKLIKSLPFAPRASDWGTHP